MIQTGEQLALTVVYLKSLSTAYPNVKAEEKIKLS